MSATFFVQLVLSLSLHPQMDGDASVEGSLNAFDATIHLMNALVHSNPELLRVDIQGKTLDEALMPYVRTHVHDECRDYCSDEEVSMSVDEYIEVVWLIDDSNDLPSNYYYGNGCYDMCGITSILLKHLFKSAREVREGH